MKDYGALRKHQARLLRLAATGLADGKLRKMIAAAITPGAGKTLAAAIYADALAEAGAVDQVLFVVPNNPLKRQAEDGFHDFDRGLRRTLKEDSRTIPMFRDLSIPFGKVVTYAFLAANAKALAKWCRKKKTLVVFDECHHLSENSTWDRGASIVFESCAYGLSMSGTMLRWDEKKIPFVRYSAHPANPSIFLAEPDVSYTRAEALAEKAVLPVEFKFFDGEVMANAEPSGIRLSDASSAQRGARLDEALKSSAYSERLITTALNEWSEYKRENVYPGSSAIVVCHRVRQAQRAYAMIQARFPQHNPVLSVGKDGAESDKAILGFRSGKHSILVTVQKAFEGLDAPQATHLVYLHNVRSWPFMDQVIARVTRFDRKSSLDWHEQRAYVYAPDDAEMRAYVQNMLAEQVEYYRERDKREAPVAGTPRTKRARSISEWVLGDWTGGHDGHVCTTGEMSGLKVLAERFPSITGSLEECLAVARGLGLIEEADAAE